MKAAPLPANEAERVQALHRYDILDTQPEGAFDELTRLAAQLCQTPIAVVTLLDSDRQWFKSRVGLELRETPRAVSICSYVILGQDLFTVEDCRADARFAQNPLVQNAPHVRFYAGVPLTTPDGFNIGTLTVADPEPRRLLPPQANALRILARQVMTQLELRRNVAELARSVRDHERTEAALREAEAKYRSIFENVAEGIFQTTVDGHYLSVNPMLARIYGYASPEELMAAVRDIQRQLYVEPGRREEYVRLMREAGLVANFESRVRRRDGSIIWISENSRAVRDGRGRLLYFEGTVQDITARKQAEEALRNSEMLYHSLVENLPQFIFRKDAEGRFTFANKRFCEALKRPLSEILGKTDFAFFPAELAAKYQRDDLRVMNTLENFDTIEAHQAPTGEKMFVHVIKSPLLDPVGRVVGIQGIFWDVTQRRRIEEELAYERNLLLALLDTSNDRIYFKDAHSRFLRCSRTMAQRLGLEDPSAVIGKTDFDFHPKELAREYYAEEQRIILTGKPLINKLQPHVDKEGRETWSSVTKVPLYGQHREIRGIIGISRDVTDLKQTEAALARARDAAMESAKLKSQFLANMSHEVRTPISAIVGMTEMLLDAPLSEEQREHIERIRESTDGLLHIINDILDLSKIEAGRLECETVDIDLRDTVETAVEMLAERAHRRSVVLACAIAPDVPVRLRGDPVRVRQILTNLIGNAVKFTEHGEVVVRVERLAENHDSVVLQFSVCDTGIGIEPGKLSQIFDPFTQADGSTTRRYGGTGLGLAISKQLAELMRGQIGCESTPGQGSCFWFKLPFERQPAPAGAGDASVEALRGVKVLLADASSTQRQILADQLTGFGCQVVSVPSGAEAISTLKQAAGTDQPFALALLDMEMPDLPGLPLLHKVHADPTLASVRLVAMTSLGRRHSLTALQSAGLCARLLKPIRLARLQHCLLNVLTGAPGGALPADAHPGDTERVSLAATSLRILIAEDNPVNQILAVRQLKKLGYEADTASNGREVLEVLQQKPYDVVLLDCQMPEIDGYEVARRLRDASQSPANLFKSYPYLVALTAHAMQGDREKCLACGMHDYLAKPVQMAALELALERASLHLHTAASARAAQPPAAPQPATTPPVPATPPDPSLDLGIIKSLRDLRTPGHADPLRELCDLFLNDAQAKLARIERAVSESDWVSLSGAAHSLKGSSSNLGARRLSALCATLEKQAKSGHVPDAASLLKDTQQEFERVAQAIQVEVAR